VVTERVVTEYDVNFPPTSQVLTPREVAQLLHVHENTVRRWSNRGLIKAFRITRRGDRRFHKDEVQRFLSQFNSVT
jgi:excisionase family DNA binding protein